MSKGGSTTSTSSIDPQIKTAFLSNFEQAKNVAGALPVQQFAGYNPLYMAGEEALVNTALAGPGIAGTDLAAQMAAYGGVYQPTQIQATRANLGLGGGQAAPQGAQMMMPQMGGAASMVGGLQGGPAPQMGGAASMAGGMQGGAPQPMQSQQIGSIADYMNPYTSQVRANALGDLESSRQMAIQQMGERANAARAFGGSRQGVAESLTNAGFAKQAGALGTQLNEQAFNNAMALQQADIARQQQADLANQAAGLQGAQLRTGAAGQLGNLAAQQQALRLGGAQAVMGAGGARQALDQQQMDAIRNIGLQRLGIVQSSLGATPANLGMQATTPYTQNVGAGALGGALAGSQLAGALGVTGGTGAALGALASLI